MHFPQFLSSVLCRGPFSSIKRSQKSSNKDVRAPAREVPSLVVMGIGCAWPKHVIEPEDMEEYAGKLYDLEKAPAIQKMLAINRKTGIKKRHIMWDEDTAMMYADACPDIHEIDTYFREKAVPLAVEACEKALKEWGGSKHEITHVVAVTATNAGNPGYDQLVARELGLRNDVDRALLHGVGCSGGLAALRAAANIAAGASSRGIPARILVLATELCSPNIRCDLDAAYKTGEVRVGPTLFSDGSSALVLCNELAGQSAGQGIYSVVDYKTWVVPDTAPEMNFLVDPLGWKVHLSKNVAPLAAGSIKPAFWELMQTPTNRALLRPGLTPQDVDWALHPGGLSVLKNAQKIVDIADDQLRASYDVYANRGNSSSVAVLAVLDRLREMGAGRDEVIACTFGPGMTVEMATLKRLRSPK